MPLSIPRKTNWWSTLTEYQYRPARSGRRDRTRRFDGFGNRSASASLQTRAGPGRELHFGGESQATIRLERFDTPAVHRIADEAMPGKNAFASIFLTAGLHPLRLLMSDDGGSAELELFSAIGTFTSFNAQAFRLVGEVENGGLRVTQLVAAVPEPASIVTLGLAGVSLLVGAVGANNSTRRRGY